MRARFRVNNNKKRNQHRVLDVVGRSGLCDACYMFPLIVSDAFLMTNFGSLLRFTCMVPAPQLTGTLNWINQAHSVVVKQNCGFTVKFQKKVQGEGSSAERFFDRISDRRDERIREDTELAGYVKDLIERLDDVVQEAEIYGQSERTLVVMGTDIHRSRLGYLQLPVRIKGLEEDLTKSQRLE